MLNLPLKDLEVKAKNKGIKDYKTMSIDKLLSVLDASESVPKTYKKIIILITYLKTQKTCLG